MTKCNFTSDQMDSVINHRNAMTALEELARLTPLDDPNHQLLNMVFERLQATSQNLYFTLNPPTELKSVKQ